MPNPTRARAAQDGLCERCEQPVWRQHLRSRGPLPRVHDHCLTPSELLTRNNRRAVQRNKRARMAPEYAQREAERQAMRLRRASRVRHLHAQGVPMAEIARRLAVGRSTVYRDLERTPAMEAQSA